MSHIGYALNMNVKIINYLTSAEKEPFNDWIMQIDSSERAIIRIRLNRVRLGNFGDCSAIAGSKGVFELRIDHGPGYRVYFGKEGKEIVILLIGGTKRTQRRDIEKAKQYWNDYKG